jgi:hypothetical protein
VPASYQQQNVVAGERTTVTPRLTPEKASLILPSLPSQHLQQAMTHVALCCLQAFERLAENIDPLAAQHQRALYSSTLGGIVTHPAYMFIHFDDHLVQRAHGVCEDIVICEGYLYQMEEHLGRLLASAELAGLELGVSEATLRRIVLDTAAASMLMNGGCMLGVPMAGHACFLCQQALQHCDWCRLAAAAPPGSSNPGCGIPKCHVTALLALP